MDKNIQSQTEQKEQRKVGFFQSAKARLFVLTMACMSILSISAFAADGEATTATIGSIISDATTTVPSLMSLVWSVITANPLMSFFVVAAIVGVGFRFIRRGIRAVR